MRRLFILLFLFPLTILPTFAMHIMEGFLPLKWCIIWYVVVLPFLIGSYLFIRKSLQTTPKNKINFALSAAYIFILSAMKLPSVTGSSSHLTGTSFGAIMQSPKSIPILGGIVLLFQYFLLAHGGITTLGANIFSMAVVGPWVAYGIYTGLMKVRSGKNVAIFFSASVGSFSTYISTSLQLAVAFPEANGGVFSAALKFLSVFSFTQLPLSIVEGILTVMVIKLLNSLYTPSHQPLK